MQKINIRVKKFQSPGQFKMPLYVNNNFAKDFK